MGKQWTAKDIETLQSTYAENTPEKLAGYLKATPEEIVMQAWEMGMEKNVSKLVRYCGRRITNKVLLKRYRDIPPAEIVAIPAPAGIGWDIIINGQTMCFAIPLEQLNPPVEEAVVIPVRQPDLTPEQRAKIMYGEAKPVNSAEGNSPKAGDTSQDIRKPWDPPKKNPLLVGGKEDLIVPKIVTPSSQVNGVQHTVNGVGNRVQVTPQVTQPNKVTVIPESVKKQFSPAVQQAMGKLQQESSNATTSCSNAPKVEVLNLSPEAQGVLDKVRQGKFNLVPEGTVVLSKQDQEQTPWIDTRLSVTTNASVTSRTEETTPITEGHKQVNTSQDASTITPLPPAQQAPDGQAESKVEAVQPEKLTEDKVDITGSQEMLNTGKGKKSHPSTVWTIDVETMCRLEYPRGDIDMLAKKIGTSVRALISHMSKMGIKRDKMVKSINDKGSEEALDFVKSGGDYWMEAYGSKEEQEKYRAQFLDSSLNKDDFSMLIWRMLGVKFLKMMRAEEKYNTFYPETTRLGVDILNTVAKYKAIEAGMPENATIEMNRINVLVVGGLQQKMRHLAPERRQELINILKEAGMNEKIALGVDVGRSVPSIEQVGAGNGQ